MSEKRQGRGLAKAVVGVLSDPLILVFSLSIGKGSVTISMPDRFWLAAPGGTSTTEFAWPWGCLSSLGWRHAVGRGARSPRG